MTPREALAQRLQFLGQQVGIPGLELDEEGRCVLRFDEELTVTVLLHPINQRVNLAARLGTLPPDRLLEHYRTMLQANPFGRGVGESVLGLADDGVTVLMTQEFPVVGMENIEFVDLLEAYIGRCGEWQARLGSDAALQKAPGDPRDVPGFAVRI